MLVAQLLATLALGGGTSAKMLYFNSTNGVNGCGSSCKDAGTFVCLGSMASLAACEAACANYTAAGCEIMTYSPWSKHCWTRTDDVWAPVGSGTGNTAGCDPARVKGCGTHPPPFNGSIVATIGGSIGTPTHPLSTGVALDFWLPHDPNYGHKWGNASALELDLDDPTLVALATAMAPGLLRIGGSPEDSIMFDPSPDDTSCNINGTAQPNASYFCSQVHP